MWVLTDLVEALGTFGTVAGTDPIAAILLAVAVVIFAITFGVTGGLAAGAISNTITGRP